jgi:ribose transport system ATP-binding protein
MTNVLLKTEAICKDFSGVQVLKHIDLEIVRGEVLGIIGENGAGKSTLMKILGGIYTPSSGQITFEGRPVAIRGPADAKRLGISLIPQEFNLVKDLTVYDNIFLGSEITQRNGLLDKKKMMARTSSLLQELEVNIRPDERIDRLSAAEKQMVEISKAVAMDAKLLIMDEPTTVLTQYEIDILYRLMRRLKSQGVTIIYISHKLKEVKAVCDRVMVLRDGEVICIEPIDRLSIYQMAERMVGRELSQIFPPKTPASAEPVLTVRNLTVPGVLEDITFELNKGEILGLAGLVGAGRTEVAETIMGIRKHSAGEILLNGAAIEIHTPEDAVDAGINYLSEDRQGSGILTGFSVADNITLVSLRAYCDYVIGLINGKRQRAAAQQHVDRFNIKTQSLDTRLEFLSGGNQQKVSLAKSIDPQPLVLIADEPTRGVDVSAKQEIYRFIKSLADIGLSCIFISSEQEEIVGMCHRVLVMKDGRIMGSLTGDEISEAEIMFLATGVHETDTETEIPQE